MLSLKELLLHIKVKDILFDVVPTSKVKKQVTSILRWRH